MRPATQEKLRQLAILIRKIAEQLDIKVSSRGWCYLLEGRNIITKGEFGKTEDKINDCRKFGFLPIDFVAEELARSFSCVEDNDETDINAYLSRWIDALSTAHSKYDMSFWTGQEYYIQLLVEKIDLKTLFEPICERYHIPIATSKGWSSILQRAEIIERFKQAEEIGLTPVLLYCGDFDPAGLHISDNIKKNLDDLSTATKWTSTNLVVDRFGLNYDFIIKANLTWIDNLQTGSGKQLSDPDHVDHYKPYVQNYLKLYGARKCEANAIIVKPEMARDLCLNTIKKYLGDDALSKFENCKADKQEEIEQLMMNIGLYSGLERAKEQLDKQAGERNV